MSVLFSKNPGEGKPSSIISENIDVSLKGSHISNGYSESKHSGYTTEASKTPSNWTDQMAGVSYPPNDLFQNIKTDKYPTQESLNSECDPKMDLTNTHKGLTTVTSNGTENHNNSENKTILRSSSTYVHVGSDTSAGKSLNLMEFPSTLTDEVSGKGSNVTNKVVSSSQGSSIQVIKPSVSRQVR